MRDNPVLWRIAEWLYNQIACPPNQGDWANAWEENKNWLYDKAAIIYHKIIENEFTELEYFNEKED